MLEPLLGKCLFLKGIVHNILSLFTHLCVVPNLYDFCSFVEHRFEALVTNRNA